MAGGGSFPASADSPHELVYEVKHSVFGDIGTYSNLIESSGGIITIKTAAHFLVKALGVGLHREDAQRVEQWQGDRLIFFHGVTVKNGETTEVKGEAKGGNFVITSPLGTITAPGSVRPANPWSSRSIDSNEMMRVDNGKIEQVRVTGGGPADVVIGGATVATRQYEIDGASRYKVWFDKDNISVMFAVDDDSGKITFTLEK